ncbi:NUMOD4 motif-containing HNH endonuclease [Mycobacterium marinum]|uniref:NUMOD4 motif-containing HNH endonuclease n=1 Tax=Mycobacterium marinum TaxID=1781 RepID=UPI0035661A6D
MTFNIGDQVWWKTTATTIARGTVRELEDRPGVQPDGETALVYLDGGQLHRVYEPGVYRPGQPGYIAPGTPEQWCPVVGYEGVYEVSDHGRVRSIDRVVPSNRPGKTRLSKGQIMTGFALADTGHQIVWLSREGRRSGRLIHRLVLEAFVGPCPPGMESCHRNDISSDNRLTNLRWDTRSGNQLDAVRNGIHGNTRKDRCPRGHKYDLTLRRTSGREYRACSRCRRIARDEFNARQKGIAL